MKGCIPESAWQRGPSRSTAPQSGSAGPGLWERAAWTLSTFVQNVIVTLNRRMRGAMIVSGVSHSAPFDSSS